MNVSFFIVLRHVLAPYIQSIQESRVVARKPRDAAAVLFGLKFADNIHYNFKSSGGTDRQTDIRTDGRLTIAIPR